MPANLSPEYKDAQEAYRKARDPEERLECLREMLRTIPRHKGTERLQADIRTRLKELTEERAAPRKGGARGGPPVAVRPEGAAQVALLGPPNSGKSSLHARLTGSHALVGPYPFTTKLPLPALLLASKSDRLADPEAELEAFRQLAGHRFPALAISAETGHGLARLGPSLFEMLGVVRVYTKLPGHPADRSRPFTVRRDGTVRDVARLVHRGLAAELKFARLWGSGKFDGEQVSAAHPVRAGDVVELHG